MLAPQSCPATAKRPTPSPSSKAMVSIARMPLLPVRGAAGVRKRVSPKPRRVGTMVRSPARFSTGAKAAQVDASSGQPCNRTTVPRSPPPLSS